MRSVHGDWTVASAELTQNQRGPVRDPSFKTLMEDLVQEHDGLTGEGQNWSQISVKL